jgi:hypothetical protein
MFVHSPQLTPDSALPGNLLGRIPLGKKRSTDIITGEICLGFEVLDPFAYAEVGCTSTSSSIPVHNSVVLLPLGMHVWGRAYGTSAI